MLVAGRVQEVESGEDDVCHQSTTSQSCTGMLNSGRLNTLMIFMRLCREIEQLQDTLLSSRCEVQELKGLAESLRDQLNAMTSAIAEANQGAVAAGQEAEHARAELAASELMLAETQRAMRGALEDAERWRERTEALAERHDKLSRVVQVGVQCK